MYKKAYIEITNICNLSCTFCPKTKRDGRLLTLLEFRHIISEIKPLCNYLYFHILGEPLLHPDFDTMVSIAHDEGFYINIVTNGVLASKISSNTLSKLRKITFSLHSFEANIRNTTDMSSGIDNDALHHYLAPIMDIAHIAQCIVELRLWNGGGMNKLNGAIIDYINSNMCTLIDSDKPLPRNTKLGNNVYLTTADKFDWVQTDSLVQGECDGRGVYCRGLIDQFGILSDGTVVPCCLDGEGALALGNIHDTSLADILSSDMATRIREGFLNRTNATTVCSKCDYAKRF